MIRSAAGLIALLLVACVPAASSATDAAPPLKPGQAEAVFAMGCFWCVEKPFDDVPGVLSTTSGYTGGSVAHPTYDQVTAKTTGHYEAIRVVYDPGATTYAKLLDVFWKNIDPLQSDGQFCDRGEQYRTAAFTNLSAERSAYKSSKKRVEAFFQEKVVTELLPTSTFWVAEDFHQDFYATHPEAYQRYRWGCGRDQKLKEIWGKDASH